MARDSILAQAIAEQATPRGAPADLDRVLERLIERLIERIGDARFVLLGEATHGTDEFYRLVRARAAGL
jgi:erythromycin esterase-like protein